ncbi:MAG: hypothetical protein ACEQSL_05280 [Sediminibacterium sp.]
MLKRLSIILPLLFALLSFKVSATVLVLTGGLLNTESAEAESKENSIHHYIDSEHSNSFEEFIEEQEEEEDSESSLNFHLSFYHQNNTAFISTRQIKCRQVKRKLFMLYKSYKIDCCKF